MRQHLWSILFLVICLTALLVKSESFTEVDDDGNEIEVKRFYIEGRQLNGGRRQCYETRRRKRSYAYGQEDDKSNDEILTATSTSPSGIDTAVSIDEEDDMEEDKPVGVYGIRQGSADNGEQNMADDGADEDENEDGQEATVNLPVVAQITHQSSVQSKPAAVDSNQNGIVIVQGNMPPKVDPQTHAVFELLPVGNEEHGDDGLDHALDGDDYGDDSLLLYQEEISPVTTTGIWSTGEDEPLPYGQTELETDPQDYADIDEEQNGTAKPKPSKKPSKRPTKKPSKKPSRKPSRRPVKKRPNNKRPNNKRPNTSSGKRRRPSKRNKNSSKRRGTSNNKRRRQRPNYENDDFDGLRLTANRLKNQKLDNLKYKRKQLNKENEANQGVNTFTKTETLTQTGTGDDEKNVNCIIINKTTTPRPFWGLFGRSADGDEAEATTAKPYGRRKRINFSLPA